jgi:cyclase
VREDEYALLRDVRSSDSPVPASVHTVGVLTKADLVGGGRARLERYRDPVSVSRSSIDHELPPPRLQEVSEGIYAYVQLHGQWGLNNAGVFRGRDALTLVDTCFTVRRAQAFLDTVRTLTDLPMRTLVNTHHHGDHTYGNFLVSTATIVGHELTRQEMLATGLSTQRLFGEGVDWGDISIAPPFVTFTDRLTLYVDELRIDAIFVGPAHTTNDVVYHVPERRLLFSGDLVFNGGTPFVLMGSVAGSLAAYHRLRALDVDTVVPGHGPVCGPDAFDRMTEYLRFVQRVALNAWGLGLAPLDAARAVDLGSYRDWHDPERLVGNLHRAYSELRGEPLGVRMDWPAVVAEMVAYNRGEPLRCLA